MINHQFTVARFAFVLLVLFAPLCAFAHAASKAAPAKRDHLTAQEADLVREEQALDRRTAVFVKAVERRFLVLTDTTAAASKAVQKDSGKWGELPKGTRTELLGDIAKILDEAITNIDDVAGRQEPAAFQISAQALRSFHTLSRSTQSDARRRPIRRRTRSHRSSHRKRPSNCHCRTKASARNS